SLLRPLKKRGFLGVRVVALGCFRHVAASSQPSAAAAWRLGIASLLLPAEAIPSPAGQPGQTKRRPAAESDRPPRGLRTRRESVLRVREQGHLPRPLDGAGELPLVPGAVARDAAGDDLGPLRQVTAKARDV